ILCVFFPVYKQETSLTNKNWKKTTKGEWIIKFYSDKCGACGKATEIPWFRAPDSYGVRGLVSFLSVILKFQRLYQTFVEKNKYPGWLLRHLSPLYWRM
ncbi:hypothetical protein MXB_2557, partial [Myxobolus squamalis]